MTRPVFILGLSAALAALIGATWYMRPMYEVGPIGIRGRTRHAGRMSCVRTRDEVFCSSVVPRGEIPADQVTLSFDPRSRRISSALHARRFADSARWQSALDSVRQALGARYGSAVTCDDDPRPTRHPAYSEGWHSRTREVRLIAGFDTKASARDPWYLSLLLRPRWPPTCTADVRPRLLTAAEIRSALREWMYEHIGF